MFPCSSGFDFNFNIVFHVIKFLVHHVNVDDIATTLIKLTIFIKELPSYFDVQPGICSAISNLIFLDKVTKKGTLLTNITSAVRVTQLCNLQ